MNKKSSKASGSGAKKASDKISLTKLAPEIARKNMKALLLANPNYFGNFKESGFKSVLPIEGDTAYENIGCVGFNPQLNRLEAVVYINQESGYNGDVCTSGSQEFVRFYLSYDNGVTWQDQGLTNFTVYDVPGAKPLEYDATLQISPPEGFCFFENLPKARAILSWNTPPPANNAAWTPVWGDVVDVQIQIAGFDFILLDQFLVDSKIKLAEEFKNAVDLTQPIKAAVPKSLGAADLHALYKEKKIPGHRYLFTELTNAVKAQVTAPNLAQVAPIKSAAAAAKIAAPKISFAGISDIDLASLIEQLLNTDGDTTYEELDCVGLNSNLSQLVGVINVKLDSGYSGGPCFTGSQEYVAFWVDWGSGWEYAGTTSVTVHDFSDIPAGGLQYSVFLPIDLSSHQQPCDDGAKTAKVRAVLSWNVPPSSTDPYASVTWGNSDETLILINPGPTVQPGQQIPFLSRVGDIDESLIDSTGLITDAYTLETGVHYIDAPFGGVIKLAGFISNPVAGMKYRIMKKPHGAPDTSYAPIINEPIGLTLTIDEFNGVSWTQTPLTLHDLGSGYYSYENYSSDHAVEGNLMGVWYTGAADTGNTYDLRIDLNTDGNPADDVHSNVVTVQVNNAQPVALLDITLGGECGDFNPGDTFTGNYTATASDFGWFSFVIQPSGPPSYPSHGVLPVPASGTSTEYGGGIPDPGASSSYTLDTTGMDPCGYSLTLQVWDRTNVNSGETYNYNQASVGFCLNAD
jgi:hypothetical protein